MPRGKLLSPYEGSVAKLGEICPSLSLIAGKSIKLLPLPAILVILTKMADPSRTPFTFQPK